MHKAKIENPLDLTPDEYNSQKKKINCDINYHSYAEKNFNYRSFSYYLDDSTFHCKSFFDNYFVEDRPSDSNAHGSHRMFDLHGYTTIGAEQALRRILLSVDRSRQQVIKLNVGQGSHSIDKKARLPNVVKKVANDLQLPTPVKHEKNPGYLLMILPPISQID